MSHMLLLGQMLCSGFSLHLCWPLLLLSYKHLDTWDNFLSSFAVQPRYLSVQTLLITHFHPKNKQKKLTLWWFHSSVPLLNRQPRSELPVNWNTPSIPYPVMQNHLLRNALLHIRHPWTLPFLPLCVLRVQTPGSLEQEMVQKELSQCSFPSFIQLTHVGARSTTLMQLPKSPST